MPLPANSSGQEGLLGEVHLDTLETARHIADIISSMMGVDVLLLDISDVTLIADYFVIASAESERQMRAISEEIVQRLKDQDIVPLSTEGTPASGWMLLDYGSIVVHLFSESQRERYRLEELWSNARTLLRMA
jgi:ribosome-associated protein